MLGLNIKKLNPLRRVSREFIGISFGANEFKLSHISSSPGENRIVNLLSCDISGQSDIDAAKTLKGAFNDLKANTETVIDIIPSNLTITKNIEIPSVDADEIREIINLQAGRHTPYSREEIIVDYINIGTYKSNYTKILLIIVARSQIKRHYEILEKAGLKLERVLFGPEGLAWSVSKLLKVESQRSPVNLIHIDTDFTDFMVVFKNKVIFVRSIPIGAQHILAEREKNKLRFAEEIKKSFEAYQSEDIEKIPTTLLLTGGLQELKDLEDILVDTLHLPAMTAAYFKNLSVPEEVIRTAIRAKPVSYLGVVSPVLSCEELKVSLIPEEVKLKKQLEERGRGLLKTGIFILTLFILVFSMLISRIYFKSAYVKKLDVKYRESGADAQKLESSFEKINLLKSYLARRGYSLEILAQLYDVATLDLEFSEVRYDMQGKLSVRGTAETMSSVFALADSLKKSKYLKDVDTRYTAMRREGQRDVADFEIVCVLNEELKK